VINSILSNAQLDGSVIQSTTNVLSESQERDTLSKAHVPLSAKAQTTRTRDGNAISLHIPVKIVLLMIRPVAPKEVLHAETVKHHQDKNSSVIELTQRIQNALNVMIKKLAAKNTLKLAKHAFHQLTNSPATIRL
jgi:hypothetical protein